MEFKSAVIYYINLTTPIRKNIRSRTHGNYMTLLTIHHVYRTLCFFRDVKYIQWVAVDLNPF